MAGCPEFCWKGNKNLLSQGNLRSAGIPPENLSSFPDEFNWHFNGVWVDLLLEFSGNATGFSAVIRPAGIPLLSHWNNFVLHWNFWGIFSLEFEGTPVEFRRFVIKFRWKIGRVSQLYSL